MIAYNRSSVAAKTCFRTRKSPKHMRNYTKTRFRVHETSLVRKPRKHLFFGRKFTFRWFSIAAGRVFDSALSFCSTKLRICSTTGLCRNQAFFTIQSTHVVRTSFLVASCRLPEERVKVRQEDQGHAMSPGTRHKYRYFFTGRATTFSQYGSMLYC